MAQVVTAYRFSKSFKKEYGKLPKEIQNSFDQKLPIFLQNRSHPSLRVKRIQGAADRWEGSVSMKYRFTFQQSGGSVLFRAIGTHDILARESRKMGE